MRNPLLTVVMPVYNGEKHLRLAIESVLSQTFENFEFLIINDGSVDRSMDIISSYSDERIQVINNPKNLGVAYCRNLGLKLATGTFLGWTDCDDLNMPTRFEEQIDFLLNSPDFGGCGTWLSRFKDKEIHYVTKALKSPEEIKAALLFQPSAIPNATAVLRLSEIRKNHLQYNPELPISEDYDFIFRCAQHFKFTNIQSVLYKYRDSESSIMKKFEEQEQKSFDIIKIVYRQVLSTLCIKPTDIDLKTHFNICSKTIFDCFSDYEECYNWLKKMNIANMAEKTYDEKALDKILANQFVFTTKKASKFGFKTLYFFVRKSSINNWHIGVKNFLKVTLRCVLKYDKFEFKTKHLRLMSR